MKKQDAVVQDRTFGLKNKGKSAKVQKFVQQVQQQARSGLAQKGMLTPEQAREKKKQEKIAKMKADEELRALFSDALTTDPKKAKEKEKQLHTQNQAAGSGGGGKKGSDHYDDAWAEAQLQNDIGLSDAAMGGFKPLEVRIEEQRQKMKAEGKVGTPVTAESLAAWKERKAQRRRAEIEEKVKAERMKKKGGAGLSILSGRELYEYNKELFVDDEEAGDAAAYERAPEDDDDDAAAGSSAGAGADDGDLKPAAAGAASEGVVSVDGVKVHEELYAGEDDVDLDDLDDDDDDGGGGGGGGGSGGGDGSGDGVVRVGDVKVQESLYLDGDDDLDDLDDLDDD